MCGWGRSLEDGYVHVILFGIFPFFLSEGGTSVSTTFLNRYTQYLGQQGLTMNGSTLEPIEILLWSMDILVFCVITISFIYKYRKMEAGTRAFIMGIIVFAGFFTISRIIETVRKVEFGTFYQDIYLLNFKLEGIDLILRLLYYLFIWTGIAIFYFVFEKYVMNKKTRFILFITSLVTLGLSIIIYFTGFTDWIFIVYAICFFIVGLFPIALFLYLSRKALNTAQRIAWLIIVVGFIFLLLGVLGDMPEAYIVTQYLDPTFIRYFTPISQTIGALLMAYSLSIIYKYV